MELRLNTLKLIPFVLTPLVWTTTLPVVAPVGTGTVTWVALHVVGIAVTPLNWTVLVPWDVPKFVPEMVTAIPTAPNVGEMLVMLGVGLTVNVFPLLASPATVTMTFPVVAPLGAGVTILVAVQLLGKAVVPLNVMLLAPWLEPKPLPLMVTDVPTASELGDRLLILGAVTVNDLPLLAVPATVTRTLPVVAPVGTMALIVVALHEVMVVAVVPLKVTLLPPWLEPKPVPVIVTDEPDPPDVDDRLVMLGGVTVNGLALLAVPATVTITLPVVAPAGTMALIVVVVHDVMVVAVVPLNLTVLPLWLPKFVPVIVTDRPAPPEVGDKLVILGAASARGGNAINTIVLQKTRARVSIIHSHHIKSWTTPQNQHR
jgi:hypothetical protein